MQVLIKKTLVKAPTSRHNNKVVDLLINNGVIEIIDDNIVADADIVIDEKSLICTIAVSYTHLDVYKRQA